MSVPRILALDLSLTATGVAYPDGRAAVWSTKYAGDQRLSWFRLQVETTLVIEGHKAVDLLVIEGHAFSSRNSQTHALGELAGVVRLAAYDDDSPLAVIPPASLKKYASGKGNAAKADVLTSAVRRLDYAGHDNNEADALWLREMALDHYSDGATARVPKDHREALVKIAWPVLTPIGAPS